jgi:hypothetical protein
MARETIRRIREAVRSGKLPTVFGAADVNAALSIHWAESFLAKHRVGNPGSETSLFVQVSRGRYRLR